jgi:TPR repeat protein
MIDVSELASANKAVQEGRVHDCLAILVPLAYDEGERGALAAYSLGILFEGGLGVAEDKAKAVGYYQLSEARGYAMASYRLALLLKYSGNFAESLVRFKNAAQSNPSAAWQAYLIMSNKPELSDGSAQEYLQLAAAQGHLRAKRALLGPALRGTIGVGGFIHALVELGQIIVTLRKLVKNGEKLKYQ